MKSLSKFLGQASAQRRPLKRLDRERDDQPVYAVGDVHGCLDALLQIEDEIEADARHFHGTALIVMLGDYVDRGPASAGVIDHLMRPPSPGFERVCLAGNHELVMLDYLEGRAALSDWLRYGADETLQSYGIDTARITNIGADTAACDEMIRRQIPLAHLHFLRSLAIVLTTPDYMFVHAGYRPDMPLASQDDWQLATIRKQFYERSTQSQRIVVHGHTPVEMPLFEGRHVNIDTGACFTGRLTGLRLWRQTGRFLSNRPGGLIRPAIR